MTPILHSAAVARAVLPALVGLLLVTACATRAAAPVARSPDALTPAQQPHGEQAVDRAATHVGRTVLTRADAIVRGRLAEINAAGGGAEVGRLRPSEWLRPADCAYEGDLVVLSVQTGALPAPGRDALFLLHARRASDNFELVDVATLDDPAGTARLATMRRYLEIEALPTSDERVAALRTHLRAAAVGDEEWPRANAAREYAALADEFPGALQDADRVVIEQAIRRGGDRASRKFLETALAACPGAAPRASKPTPAASAARVAPFVERYSVAGATAAMRRQAVVDAAAQVGTDGAALYARALEDLDAPVRDAAVAAAGQCGVTALAPRVAQLLVTDPSPQVRRTLVMACGHLRAADAVPSLGAIARTTGPLTRDAMFALARIRDDAALAELRRVRDETSDPAQRDEAEFLLSDRFVEQERALEKTR